MPRWAPILAVAVLQVAGARLAAQPAEDAAPIPEQRDRPDVEELRSPEEPPEGDGPADQGTDGATGRNAATDSATSPEARNGPEVEESLPRFLGEGGPDHRDTATDTDRETQERWTDPSAPRHPGDPATPPPGTPVSAEEERPTPRFDGRDAAPTTPGRAMLWIPRVLLAPLYFVAEFLIRRPLSWLVPRAEEAQVIERIGKFFTFGDEGQFFLIPTFSYDFGFRPNAGIYFKWSDAFVAGNSIRYQFSFGGLSWIDTAISNTYQADDFNLGIRFGFTRRADGAFSGIGEEARQGQRSRFDWEGIEASVSAGASLWQQSSVRFESGVRWRQFGNEPSRGISIAERIEQGELEALPPGFAEGYAVHFTGVSLDLDSRDARPAPGSGFRFRAAAEVAYDLREGAAEQLWISYGGALSAYVDVSGKQHVLRFTLGTAMATALAGDVPFTELPELSGSGPMRGFQGNFLIGESHVYASLRYTWPVWVLLDGAFHVAFGNVFGPRYEGFAFDRLRMSFGIGLLAVDRRDHFFELIFGFGTDTFENTPDLASTRFFIGGSRAF